MDVSQTLVLEFFVWVKRIIYDLNKKFTIFYYIKINSKAVKIYDRFLFFKIYILITII
jgi:hypothetical protein